MPISQLSPAGPPRRDRDPVSAMQGSKVPSCSPRSPASLDFLPDHLVAVLPLEVSSLASLARTQRRWRNFSQQPQVLQRAWERTALGDGPWAGKARQHLSRQLLPQAAPTFVQLALGRDREQAEGAVLHLRILRRTTQQQSALLAHLRAVAAQANLAKIRCRMPARTKRKRLPRLRPWR